MAAFVALLRAVNIGGRWIKMADLKALFVDLGYGDVATYVQSGNVTFTADDEPAALKAAIEAAIADRFGFHSDTIIRTGDELRALIAANPFPEMAVDDPAHLVVHFFAAPPTTTDKAALAMEWAGPEQWRLAGHHLVITYPAGIGRSQLKLKLKTPTTARNWKSVTALAAMAGSSGTAEGRMNNSQRRRAAVRSARSESPPPGRKGEEAMAKGQQKPAKEKRKPKADKNKPKKGAPAAMGMSSAGSMPPPMKKM
jgi:uncharacterized protein (DUF1697 family)